MSDRRLAAAGVRRAAVLAVVFAAVAVGAAAPGDPPLIDAVRRADVAAVRSLLRQRVNVDGPGPDGTTPLHWAATADDIEMTRLLLGAGARADVANRYGVTPLAVAAVNGSLAVTTALLEAGADARGRVGDGETVLMAAARTGRPAVAQALIERGADVNAREPWHGETALMWAAGENHGDMVRLLAAHGADLDAKSNVLEFPKVKVDLATMVTTALPRGGLTALMLAARQGARDAALALLEQGAPPDTTDPDGTTALVVAIINAHYDVAAALVDKGAGLDVADVAGMTPLYAAVDMQRQDPMVNRPLPKASGRLSARDVVALLLDRGANANAPLRTPLLMRQHNGGDPQLGEGATPLMRATKGGDMEMMRQLLRRAADANLRARNGTTALTLAVARGGRGVSEDTAIGSVGLLLDAGADLHAANDSGQTALHLAVGRGDRIVRLLVERGARLDAKDSFGRTPLDVALGVPGGRGRGGQPAGPGPVFESTAALLKQLMTGAEQRP
jgi:ankyrin repeat protein